MFKLKVCNISLNKDYFLSAGVSFLSYTHKYKLNCLELLAKTQPNRALYFLTEIYFKTTFYS